MDKQNLNKKIYSLYQSKKYSKYLSDQKDHENQDQQADLSRYSIYKKSKNLMCYNSSLVNALKLQIELSSEIIESLNKEMFYPPEKIQRLSDMICCQIKFYKEDGSSKIYMPRNKGNNIIVKICHLNNHYLIAERVRSLSSRRICISLKLIKDMIDAGYVYVAKNIQIDRPIAAYSDQTDLINKNPKNIVTHSISYADIECVTRPYHQPFMYARYCDGKYFMSSYGYDSDWIGISDFLRNFQSKHNIIYFHNLKYDWSVIKKCPFLNIVNIIKSDNCYYSIKFTAFKMVFELRDSYKFFPAKLNEFSSSFGITDIKKHEYILYELYTKKNTSCGCKKVNFRKFNKHEYKYWEYAYEINNKSLTKVSELSNNIEYIIIDDRIVVDHNIIKLAEKYFHYTNSDEGIYFHIAHCEYYIHSDCKLLYSGMTKYEESMNSLMKANIHSNITLPSMIHSKLINSGCYQGVLELSGKTRKFVAESIQGGRVCSRYNMKWDVKGKIHVLDARSLYPSAIVRLCEENIGFPKGPARKIDNWDNIKNYHHYVVRIKISKIHKIQQLPFISYLSDGLRIYTNTVPKTGELDNVVVDKITLEDWIKYHNIEYTYIEGIYWNEGCNVSIGPIVSNIYSERISYIKNGNLPMANVCKLALNSLYGKTTLKAPKSKIRIKDKSLADQYIMDHFDDIMDYEEAGNKCIFNIITGDENHKNMCHVGGIILSMSKRIINEVLDVANSLSIPVLYTDTDSIHIVDKINTNSTQVNDGVKSVVDEYFNIYSKNLIGDSMGQFHFELKNEGCNDIYSERCLIVGKKTYLHVVTGIDSEGIIRKYNHIRIKGVNAYALDEYKDHIHLYERMYNGEEISFDLSYGNAVLFSFKNQVMTRESFVKKLSFDGEIGII
jgi:hypothetical protein